MTLASSVSPEQNIDSPSKCVVLVPAFSHIEPKCEITLRELESRGYVVRRQFGFSQIDFGRNVMASVALRDGFEQLMWIDADISFQPDFVDQLRRHQLPIVTGIYTKKGPRALACEVLPETAGAEKVPFVPDTFSPLTPFLLPTATRLEAEN